MQQEVQQILRLPTREGLFPTYRAKKGETIVESPEYRVDNIGVHTFVLEKLLLLHPENPEVQGAFQRGLDFLIKDAVNSEGLFGWRWLRHPSKEDWLYPIDSDDTARARTVIELANARGFKVPKEFRDFDYTKFIEGGLTPLGGRLTFVGFKPDDSLCPVVNANLLYSYALSLKKTGGDTNQSRAGREIKRYLERVVRTSEFNSPNFARCSKFYLSHNLLACLMSGIEQVFDEETLGLIKKRVEREVGEYSNPLEAAWGTSALINLGGDSSLIRQGVKQIEESADAKGMWPPEPFYQHQRSGSVFGSSAGTSVFCLETLGKSRMKPGK